MNIESVINIILALLDLIQKAINNISVKSNVNEKVILDLESDIMYYKQKLRSK